MADDSPALAAAKQAQEEMYAYLDEGQDFAIIAGAGAGKTYTLEYAIRHLLDKRHEELQRRSKRIACITYTNVAANEILERTDNHPLLFCDTIHAFCWSLMGGLQTKLRAFLLDEEEPVHEAWLDRLSNSPNSNRISVIYNKEGNRTFDHETNQALLHHDDVITIFSLLLGEAKFRSLVVSQYPVILIDEFQDTHTKLADALKAHVLGQEGVPCIGLFGDPWQKIYGHGCGDIEHDALRRIDLQSNFRSAPVIIDALNKMRDDLHQEPAKPQEEGAIAIFHTNGFEGVRQKGYHKGDLHDDDAASYFEQCMRLLRLSGWDEEPHVLMLTHKALAKKQGYGDLLACFRDKQHGEDDPFVTFAREHIEPVATAFAEGYYARMFAALGKNTPGITKHADKISWHEDMTRLTKVRETGTIDDVITCLNETKRPHLPDSVTKWLKKVQRTEKEWDELIARSATEQIQERTEHQKNKYTKLRNLLQVPYSQVTEFINFLDDLTGFQTKHGVKGAEYEDVLIIIGREWNDYQFHKLLSGELNDEAYIRTRNLFYVACSRPKKRLALLLTVELDAKALETLAQWFGEENITPL